MLRNHHLKFLYVGLKDPGMTGRFEVYLNGVLIHSKKLNGQGKAESGVEIRAIIEKVYLLRETL